MYSTEKRIRSKTHEMLGHGVVEAERDYEGGAFNPLAMLNPLNLVGAMFGKGKKHNKKHAMIQHLHHAGAHHPRHPYHHHYKALLHGAGVVEPRSRFAGAGVVDGKRDYEGAGFIGDMLGPLNFLGLGKHKKSRGSGVVDGERDYAGAGFIGDMLGPLNFLGLGKHKKSRGSGFIGDMLGPLNFLGLGKHKKPAKSGARAERGRQVAHLMRTEGLTLGEASKRLARG